MIALRQHALSAAFPSMPEADIKALATDIKTHGLHQAIVIYKGEVIDGWHRYLACQSAGVNPRTIEYKGAKPVEFVRSHNWHRRHMTESQRAMVQVSLSEWREIGQKNNDLKGATVAPLPPTGPEMAAEAGVSVRTIKDAKAVERNGSDSLKEAVREGKIPVSRAAKAAKLPKAQQVKAAERPEKKPEKPKREDNLADELERADREIRSLQALVESLKKSDLAKEVAKWHTNFDKLEGRLYQCMTTKAEAEKQARYSTGLLAKIRAALKVKKNSEILEAIRQ